MQISPNKPRRFLVYVNKNVDGQESEVKRLEIEAEDAFLAILAAAQLELGTTAVSMKGEILPGDNWAIGAVGPDGDRPAHVFEAYLDTREPLVGTLRDIVAPVDPEFIGSLLTISPLVRVFEPRTAA